MIDEVSVLPLSKTPIKINPNYNNNSPGNSTDTPNENFLL